MKAQCQQLIVLGCALLAACNASTPVQPSSGGSGDSPFAGTWVPSIVIDSCTGSHACIALDSTWSVLRLAAFGSGIRGSGYFAGRSFDVIGSVDSTGQLVITTHTTATFSLDELRLRPSPTGLTGTVRFTAAPMTVVGHITSAKHGALESTQSTAEGRWVGSSVVRECTFAGWTQCPYGTRLIELSLTQSGGTASGDLVMSNDDRYLIPVNGRFTASTLALSGAASRSYFGDTIQLRLVAWTSRTDAFGRMTGTFTLDQDIIGTGERLSVRYDAEMQDVYLLPGWFQLTTSRANAPIPDLYRQ